MYIFIVNPVAGNGRGLKVFQQVMKSESYQQITSQYYMTSYAGHAEEIVQKLTSENPDEINVIIVIGGDGTIHEVVNGLRNNVRLAFIPGGSGNDFARGCGIKGSPTRILKKILTDKNGIDYWKGNFQIDHKEGRAFANSIGFGFDAEVAARANQSIYKNILNKLRIGTLSYVLALIQVLFTFKPFNAELELDGKKHQLANCWMITIANHPYYGGGMKIIPDAKLQPDILPILVVHNISKWKILRLFMTVFTGKHVLLPEVTLYQAESIVVLPEREIAYQVDGQTNTCHSCEIVKNNQPIQIMGSDFLWKFDRTS
ncbi:diacylglycerol/lipid kinase family protein [Ornithinibacillus contaminans]|uniref:diacylglycerol/lipid kinase family protein n=1 Tax=Ornithinibacillus contaminans TaxID=694055 RepID=UPI00069CE198|nr:diacylglycerol kinase family protein [Ornithinibacillus contaminans]